MPRSQHPSLARPRVAVTEEADERCGFCGRILKQVRHMMRGPSAAICDECIELCAQIMAEIREAEEDR